MGKKFKLLVTQAQKNREIPKILYVKEVLPISILRLFEHIVYEK